MFFGQVPSWQQIEDRIANQMGYQGGASFRTHLNEYVASVSLNIRRVNSVRTAFIHAEWKARDLLRQRFSELDISSILHELLGVVTQMSMIVAGSVLTGGAIGAGVGAFAGGAGAIPMGAAGAAMGLQVSTWILGILGLTSIAEFFVEGLPSIAHYYLDGINIAWEGTQGDDDLSSYSRDDPFAQQRATNQIALGHVEVVVLLLGAIVDYLTRGRGNAHVLAQEMRTSPKGPRIGEWMLKHEDALKKRPDLQAPKSRKGAFKPADPPQTLPSNSSNKEIAGDAANASSKPEWLRRLDAGNEFNKVHSKNYPYNEVYIERPDGNGYYRVDSYSPATGEIVSRKFTQLSEISEATAKSYIKEAATKYANGSTIASVPSSGSLAGQKLQGTVILEVPQQNGIIPKSVLGSANKAAVLIRDTNGRIY
ncbi:MULTISPECIES: DUF6861 domain-containing protein [unclassified Pseudomonas]|uniref:DUF6861 domain-containing protein n=1 Tax=unclassified Pseudomonas TaxID=196821 RepID=UPI00380C1136